MWPFKKKPKCYFCENERGLLHSIHDYGLYGEMGQRIYYHPECLKMIEAEPEAHGNIMIDKALKIHELEEQNIRETNKDIVKKFKAKVEKCHANHFSRMIPKR